MDPIKEAFDKIKQDMLSMRSEILVLREIVSDLSAKLSEVSPVPANAGKKPAIDYPLISTPAHSPAVPAVQYPLQAINNDLSIGNRGVPADKPTDRQTDQQTGPQTGYANLNRGPIQFSNAANSQTDEFEKAREILDSLDNIKREIRLKFKRLTPQEMQVFSTLYSLEEQNLEEITYKILSQRLNLTESSIRDYITKLVFKGIPIVKVRQNNKKITLRVSPDLQRVASLSTITKLREL